MARENELLHPMLSIEQSKGTFGWWVRVEYGNYSEIKASSRSAPGAELLLDDVEARKLLQGARQALVEATGAVEVRLKEMDRRDKRSPVTAE